AADEEEKIRRIAGVDDVEPDPERKQERPEQRGRVLDQIAKRALGLVGEVVAMDVDAVDRLELLLVTLAGGADDRDAVPCGAQGRRLLPHATVKRAGEILDEDENPSLLRHFLLLLLCQCSSARRRR